MPDTEKIIKALKDAVSAEEPIVKMSKQATEILIEILEQNKPSPVDMEGAGSNWVYVCGECHAALDSWDKYCHECGRRIQWEYGNDEK